jgi:hypothetical protein
MEREGMGWENVDWVRVAENRVLLGLLNKTVVKLVSNMSKAGNVSIT